MPMSSQPNSPPAPNVAPVQSDLTDVLARQRAAFLRDGTPTLRRPHGRPRQAEEGGAGAPARVRQDARRRLRGPLRQGDGDPRGHGSGAGHQLSAPQLEGVDASAEAARGNALPPRPLARRLPAARRRRHHVAVELPHRAVAHAARHGHRGRQPRHDQAVGDDAGDDGICWRGCWPGSSPRSRSPS